MQLETLREFYAGKRVFMTGHTGFKGAWLCKILQMLGADVYGYALKAPTSPALYDLIESDLSMHSAIGDIRDYEKLSAAFDEADPELVFHLAAQPIVRESYRIPRETYEINVMGTVNLLECVRSSKTVRSVLNVTTDKVYENQDDPNHAFSEEDKLDGFDPYSNSKSCSELVTHAYKKSFFDGESFVPVSTARAGNVIGGGDFAPDRIIPDCVRAAIAGRPIGLRNPYSTRPYQHVLEPLMVYLTTVMEQAKDPGKAGYYNVGPDEVDCVTTGELAEQFVKAWGDGAAWESLAKTKAPHEAAFLRLDCTKLKSVFGWEPVWHIGEAVGASVEWYKAWNRGDDLAQVMEQQIGAFLQKDGACHV